METTSDFRFKFSDIRVKSKGKSTSNPYVNRKDTCHHAGCEEIGEHRAPKIDGKGQQWFCQKHAAQFNQNYNSSDRTHTAENGREGTDFEGVSRQQRFGVGGFTSSLHTRQAASERMSEAAREASVLSKVKRSTLQIRALDELGLESNATPEAIRTRYADYVRKFHPDSNDGDRSSEDKLARIIRAGKVLKSGGLM